MNKLAKLLPILVALTSLVGCNNVEEPEVHEHTFSQQYTYDSENHWHAATCEHTNLSSDITRHSFNEQGTCVCGYTKPAEVIEHVHTYSEAYTYDSENHWHVATCEHTNLASGLETHTYTDGVCKCGYTKPDEVKEHVHTYSETYSYDESYHWYASTCEHTGLANGLESHNYVGGVCKCGKKAPLEETDLVLNKEATLNQIIETFVTDELKAEIGVFAYAMIVGLAQAIEKQCVGEGTVTYKRYNFNYLTTSYDKSEVLLSGCVTVPFLNGEPAVNSIVISSHPTFTDLSEAPTNDFEIYTIPALAGAAVIEFDLLGYGITSDQPVDYHCGHLSSRNTVDGVLKCYDLLEKNFNIDCNNLAVYNIGYSQGGFDSLSLLRYLETEATGLEKARIKISETHSGSGAYNTFLMMDESIHKDSFEYSEYIIMAIVSAFTFHGELLGNYTYQDILTDKGMELLAILEHKNDAELQAFKQKKVEGTEELYIKGPRDVFKPDVFDKESALYKAIKEVAEVENLLDGDWTPEGKVTLYYSEDDEMVAPACTLAAQELWRDVENVAVEEIGGTIGTDHRSAAVDYYLAVVQQIMSNYAVEE